ncbi:MAG TPA: VOC family protein [Polyangiaceae bacterium]|nr:VOC family protein [Polyangiaceae bacterium]
MNNTFCHIELSTDDRAGAKKFYKALFGWQFKEMPDMSYTGFTTGAPPGGGMMGKNMPGQPTAWMPYVEVASVQKTVAKAKAAGATIYVPFQPIGDMGAIGVFADPTGAAIGVWEAAKKPAAKKAAPKKAAAKKAAPKKAAKKK